MAMKLSDILDMSSTDAVLAEISETARMVAAEFDLSQFRSIYYDVVALKRMDHDLGGFRKHLKRHFKKRWGINEDLYQRSIDTNIRYPTFLLAEHSENYRDVLQRDSIVKKLLSIERIGDFPCPGMVRQPVLPPLPEQGFSR
jgi:hypothetical protein